jgi:outer membrane protein insertion porin family
MTRHYPLTLASLVLLCCALPVTAQTYQPKTIQFKGAGEYSSAELSAAADLKKSGGLTTAQMNDHTKLLMDTGLFQDVSFKFNGQDLIFELTPVTQLYPLRLENFPVTVETGLDDRLHAHLPLYHGKVPTAGSLLDGIQKELQNELAAAGIKAAVAVNPYTDMDLGKVTAMSFNVTDPDVVIGKIQLQGASPAFADKAKAVLSKSSGTQYSFDGSVSQLQSNLTNFYGAQGYLEAKVKAVPQPNTVVDSNAVHIPFTLTVEEGPQYKLAGVQLAPGLIVSQAEFDKFSGLHPGEVVSIVKLGANWEFLARLYHNHGYIKAKIHPEPSFDRAQGTVSYTVNAEPGPAYATGKVRVRNVSDELRDMTLEHFLFYCRPLIASLNQAFALSGVMHGRASAMA